MAENSKIEWTDHTHNFWVGCTKITMACDFCYAESWAKRAGHPELWQGERRRTTDANWRKPLKWNAEAAERGIQFRVFTNSLADFFDNQADPEWRADAWRLIRETPNLTWQILTKRPQNIAKMLPPDWGEGYPNVWLGTTVENQEEADRRIPHLLESPAKVRFLSCEPLLGPVDLDGWLPGETRCQDCDDGDGFSANRCSRRTIPREEQCPLDRAVYRMVEHGPVDCNGEPASITCRIVTIDWVIAGGESGPHARPSHPDWFRALRDQCAAAGVPFLHKQNGEWHTAAYSMSTGAAVFRQFKDFDHWVNKASSWVRGGICIDRHGRQLRIGADFMKARDEVGFPVTIMHRVGKKAAGRLLDGVEHNGFPHE